MRREVKVHHLVQEFGSFGGSKAQVGSAQLRQLISGAQTRERQGWVLPGRDDQVHPGRQMFDQRGEGIVNRFRIREMIVIQNEDKTIRDGSNLIEQGCQDRFDGG